MLTILTPEGKVALEKELRERNRLSGADYVALLPTWIRCSLLGTAIGAIPGAGAAIGAMIADGRMEAVLKDFGVTFHPPVR